MSHIPNICGNSNAAAGYQEYLIRLGAARRARRGAELAENPGLRSFDSAIDPDHDSDHERDGGTEGGGENKAEDKADGGTGDAGEGDPGWSGQA